MAAEEAGKETARQVRLGFEASMQAAGEARLRAVEAKERTEKALAAVSAEEAWLKAAIQAEARVASASAAEQAWLKADGEVSQHQPHAQEEARASMVEGEEAEGRAAKRRHGGRDEGEGGGGGIGKGSGAGKR